MQSQPNLQNTNSSVLPHQHNHKTWIVVADSRIAKIFCKDGRKIEFLQKFDSVSKTDDGLDNETIGRGGSYGAGRHKYDPTMEESRQEQIGFAKMLTSWLEKKHATHDFSELVLVAAPEMLGELRDNLNKQVSRAIIATAAKELTNHNPPDIERELLKVIPGPDKE